MTNEELNAIWNGFGKTGQNMTKEQFYKQMNQLTDPKLMADEAQQIARGRIARKQIDHCKKR